MPDFRIHWVRQNEPIDGEPQDATEHIVSVRASTAEKAHARAVEEFFLGEDLTGFTCTAVELDEDNQQVGDPIPL